MADWGIKKAKEGKSVTSDDPRDYNLWSKYKVFKVDLSGSGSVEVAAGAEETETLNHNLGYNPLVLFYWSNDAANNKIAKAIYGPTANSVHIVNDASDTDNVYIKFFAPAGLGGETYNYYYYLLYDEGINA